MPLPAAERGHPLPGALLALAAGVATLWLHARFFGADGSLPVGDAAGHLQNIARARMWLLGGPLPSEAFPPGLYTVSALIVHRLGPTLDHANLGTACFGAGLSAMLAWLGWRASGLVAALLLPVLALAAPTLTAASRQILLDLPATACIVAVWVLLWESRIFRHALPTLLLGAALAAGALVKYTLFIWVLPTLLVTGAALVLRWPGSLLPLALCAPALGLAAKVLADRASQARSVVPAAEPFYEVAYAVLVTAVVLLGLAVRFRAREGVRRGAGLGLAAMLAVAMVFPWFHHAMPAVWEKVHHEAVTEVRTSGDGNALRFARAMVVSSWPEAWWLAQVGVATEIVALAALFWPRARRFVEAPLSPIPGVALASAAGTALTVRSLPNDVRYYLPLVAGVAIVTGLGACRVPVLRWTLGLGVLLLSLSGLLVGEGFLDGRVRRLALDNFDAAKVLSEQGKIAFAAPAPDHSELPAALERLVAEAVRQSPQGACGRVSLAVPSFHEQRALGFEGRALVSLATLWGMNECAMAEWEPGATPRAGAQWIAIAGVLVERAGWVLETLGAPDATLVSQEDVGKIAVRLYRTGS